MPMPNRTAVSEFPRGGDVLIALGDCLVPSMPNPLPGLQRESIPEGWEPIATGCSKHPPGEGRVMTDYVPRRGRESCGFFNPAGVVFISHRNPGCASRPRAIC
jgi:hypothetical protein